MQSDVISEAAEQEGCGDDEDAAEQLGGGLYNHETDENPQLYFPLVSRWATPISWRERSGAAWRPPVSSSTDFLRSG